MLKTGLQKYGLTGRLVSNVMPWFNGDSKHPDVGYVSQHPWVIEKQLSCMRAEGVDKVCVTYSGPKVSQLSHNATLEMAFQCEKAGIAFSLMLNAAMVSGLVDKTKATAEVLGILAQEEVQWMLAMSDRDLYEFDLGPNGVDLKQVQSAVPALKLGSKHVGHIWPEKANVVQQMAADFKANKATITMATCFRSFNNGNPKDRNKSIWNLNEAVTVLDPMAGNFWFDQLDVIKVNNPGVDVGILWNDYQEQADGCWEPAASQGAGIRIE